MAIALGVATATYPKSVHEDRLDPEHLERHMRQWRGLFIFINHSRIYLIHQTAKDFLICTSGSTPSPSRWKHCLCPQGIEEEMARICVTTLCLENSSPVEEMIQKLRRGYLTNHFLAKGNDAESLLFYTAEHWFYHFRVADISMDKPIAAQVSQLYDTDSATYCLWSTILSKATRQFQDLLRMRSPLCVAAALGYTTVTERMLQLNGHCDVDCLDNGQTALAWASQFGHKTSVHMLLNGGADINAQVEIYGSTLQLASYHGHEHIVGIFLDQGADINAQKGSYDTALQIASYVGHEQIVRILLDQGADVNAQRGKYGNALQAASIQDHKQIVRILLDRGADINAQGGKYGNALQAASYRSHEKIVRILLDRGVDINAVGIWGNALQLASAGDHEWLVRMLLNKGADLNSKNEDDQEGFLSAAKGGYKRVVQLFLHEGVDLNLKDIDGRTALWWALANGCVEVTEIFLQDRYGLTPLLFAARKGHKEVVKALLRRGSDPNLKERNGWTALLWTAINGHEEIVKLLLDCDKVDQRSQQGRYGQTPLLLAVGKRYETVVKLLIAQDYASLFIQDKFGRTPLSWALRKGRSNIFVKNIRSTAQPFMMKTHQKFRHYRFLTKRAE